MQLRLPWGARDRRLSPHRPRAVTVGARVFPVDIARHARARRYVLRLSDQGRLRLTVPRRSSIRGGLDFASTQTAWIEREWTRRTGRLQPWGPGTEVWFRGQRERLDVRADAVLVGGVRIARPDSDGDIRVLVESHLRELAARELPLRCLTLADLSGTNPARVRVGDQRSRWGACSPGSGITLNWRLVQMPPSVADYVMWHELAHLRQPDHSRRFWREVERLCPWWREAERWLRRVGRDIL